MTQHIQENQIKYQALQLLREVQADLTRINFLEVLSLMKAENPLRKDINKYETILNDLTTEIGKFIQDNKDEVDYSDTSDDSKEESEDDSELEDKEEVKDEKEEVKESITYVIDPSHSNV
jgi:hypothetical protein